MSTLIQPSFALGELSEDLSGRVDLEWYGKGLELCDNFHVLASGGVTLRPGTEFVGEVPGEASPERATRLIPFVFNAQETYALLFTDKAMRVIHDGGPVTGGDGQAFVLALPYALAHLADIRAAQSADVLYVVHPDYPPAKIMRRGHADWRYEVLTFRSKLSPPAQVWASTSAGPTDKSRVEYSYKVTAYDKEAGEESEASCPVTVISKNLGLEDTTITVSWSPVLGAKEYKIYKESAGMYGLLGYASLDQQQAAGAEVSEVFIDSDLFTRTTRKWLCSPGTDEAGNAQITVQNYLIGIEGHPITQKLYPSFYNSMRGQWFVFSPDLGWVAIDNVASLPEENVKLRFTAYTVYTGFGRGEDYPQGYHGGIHAAPRLPGVISHYFLDKNYEGDYSVSPPTYENPFQGAGNYPSVVAFIQQRLCFAGTRNNPQKIWMSRSGNFENFGRSNPSRDDDAIYLSICSPQVNWIRGLVALRSLVAMTGGAEWTIDAGNSSGGALTPASANVTQQSAYGAAGLEPLIVGQSILLAQRGFTAVRDLAYSYDVDGYVGNDLTIRAAHLLRGRGLTAWGYQNAPHGILWCARDDGALLALTYVKEHQVFAWSQHHTDGFVEDLCVVNSDGRDELYLVVRREVGGVWRRYVERLAEPYFARSPSSSMRAGVNPDAPVGLAPSSLTLAPPADKEGSIAYAWHVDCGLRYEGEPVSRLSGLNHLAGRAVAVLADGGPLGDSGGGLSVGEDGTLDLPRPASVILVGLPYTGTIKSMRVNTGDQTGSSQGRRQAITRLTLRFRDSVGGEVGWERPGTDGGVLETQWTEIKGRTLQMANSPAEPFSGDRTIVPPLGWDTKGQFLVRQRDPLPMTLLCAIPDVTLGG